MIRLKIIACLISAIMYSSCTKNKSTITDITNRPPTIDFPLDSISSNNNQLYQIVDTEMGMLLYVLNPFINGIDVYSMQDKKLEDRIIVHKEGPQSIASIRGFYVFTPDSLVIFSEKSMDGLFYVKGKPSKRISDYIKFDSKLLNHHIASAVPIIAFEGKLFIYSLPFGRSADFSPFQDLDMVLDFDKQKIDRIYSTKSFLEMQGWGALGYPTRCLDSNKGTIVYSYPFTDQLMIYDIRSQEFTYHSLISNQFKFNTKSRKADSNEEVFLLENNYYDAIIYNSFNKRYYRFARQYVDLKSENGKDNTIYDQPATVIVADSVFNIIKEITLKPIHNFLLKDFFITPDGLMISNANPRSKNLKEDRMIFQLIK